LNRPIAPLLFIAFGQDSAGKGIDHIVGTAAAGSLVLQEVIDMPAIGLERHPDVKAREIAIDLLPVFSRDFQRLVA
jgi:hypothetical protein